MLCDFERIDRDCGRRRTARRAAAVLTAAFALAILPPATAQQQNLPWTTAPTPAPVENAGATAKPGPSAKTFSQEELDQLLAPVALYPDALLAQVLMAATYPLEIVAAERWVKANPGLKDKALEDALVKQAWDPSVKSLCVFPQVLVMMSEKIDWTQKLGDAFLAQQKDVLDTAQTLRRKAQDQGNLKDTSEQKVVTETVQNTTVIKIEPANPEVVYVPTYNPTVVYGSWWYPSYPPYYYYPPGYVAGGALLGFTAGVIVGGAIWGNVNWGGGDVNIDIDRQNNFTRNTNRSGERGNQSFKHNAEHRGGVPYRDQNVARQNGRGTSADAASREAFRGRAEAGQGAIQRGEVSPRSGTTGGFDRTSAGAGSRGDYSGTRNAGAFDTRGGGSQARDYGSRGASSMGSARSSGNMSASRGSMSGGGARGGGGGARGGGGGGRGGRR